MTMYQVWMPIALVDDQDGVRGGEIFDPESLAVRSGGGICSIMSISLPKKRRDYVPPISIQVRSQQQAFRNEVSINQASKPSPTETSLHTPSIHNLQPFANKYVF